MLGVNRAAKKKLPETREVGRTPKQWNAEQAQHQVLDFDQPRTGNLAGDDAAFSSRGLIGLPFGSL